MARPKTVEIPVDSPMALALVAVSERRENYGSPLENFEHIAELWEAMFGWDVEPEDVAMAMVLLKGSRLYRTPSHEDSAVDIHGYTDAYWKVIEERRERDGDGPSD